MPHARSWGLGVSVASRTQALDGSIAALLVKVVDAFSRDLVDEGSVRSQLSLHGIEGAGADAIWLFIGAHAAQISQLRTALPDLLAELATSSPDFSKLVLPAAKLWGAAAALARQAPAVSLPGWPGAGTYLDMLLGEAVEEVVADLSPGSWALLRSLHLLGPGLPLTGALGSFIDDPMGFVWARIQAERRDLDLTLAGLVTGPRVTSILTTPSATAGRIVPEVAAAFPSARQVLARMTIRLAADTYDDPVPVVAELLGTDSVPPAFAALVLRTSPWPHPFDLSPHLQLNLEPPANALGIGMSASRSIVPIGPGQPRLSLASSFDRGFTLGADGGLRMELSKPVVEASLDGTSWMARAGVESFSLRIPPNVLGPVLGTLLPRQGIEIRGRLMFRLDGQGLHMDGAAGMVVTSPESIRLPGMVIHSLKTEVGMEGRALRVRATGTMVFGFGPLTVTMEGLGLDQRVEFIADGSGNLGLFQIDAPTPARPAGLGLRLDAAIVKGGGFLRMQGDEVAGAMELALTLGGVEIDVRAAGVLGSIDNRVSLVVVMSMAFSPPLELFLGLTLNAVGGVFALNRTVDVNALGGVVRDGRAGNLLFPDDPVARADEVIGAIKSVFPPKAGQYVIGPMLRLGWGRPVSFVTADVGLLMVFPQPTQLVILGQVRIALPASDLALINLQAGFTGGFDFGSGNIWFDASLERSTIGLFDVAGDVALRAGPSGFLFSAGGFHPRFQAPSTVPPPRRLSISISPSPILHIAAAAYFAVTASTLQFGAGLRVEAKLGPIGARGSLTLDVLIHTEPHLAFIAELTGGFALTFAGEEIASVHLDVLLEGPGRWHARAHASIELLFIEVSGTINLAWGHDAGGLLPPVDVPALVRQALLAPTVWTHVLPAADAGMVTLRDGADGLHPLGSLRVTQTVAPLGESLQRFGGSDVSSRDPIQVQITSVGAGDPGPMQELFAPAQFFAMSDDERLSKPAFIPYQAGATLKGEAYSPVQDALTVDIVYEEATSDRPRGGRGRPVKASPEWMGWIAKGAAGRHHAGDGPIVPRRDLGIQEPVYTVADVASGQRQAVATGKSIVTTSIMRSADSMLLADYELEGAA